MTQSFINPLSKFTSDTLKTLPYSRLYFFENESSTPKEIFKDKAKTISWGVYAEADSAGNFPPIWFDGICRATLKWSSNWLTDPIGVVQTQWPIDNIGTDQSFDTDVTIAGDLTANNVYSEGVVQAAGNAGFQSTEYTLNARNPIWSFGNADTYGISYFAGTPSIGADDKIGIHFGTATLLGSEYTFDDDGNFAASTKVTAPTVQATAVNATTATATNVVATNGASFGNTANASLTVLDYYLEGTFTPRIEGGTFAGSASYSLVIGKYTRIGNVVFYNINLSWTGHTGTGAMYVRGLPLSATNSNASSVDYDNLTVAAGKTLSVVLFGTEGAFYSNDPAGGARAGVAVDIAGDVIITGHYFV